MPTDKTFTVCGISTDEAGVTKVRFANDVMRVKVLDKCGHTEILLVELPTAMQKMAAAEFIRNLPEFQSNLAQATIDDYIERNQPKEPKRARKPSAEAAAAATPTATAAPVAESAEAAAAPAATADADEDAPF